MPIAAPAEASADRTVRVLAPTDTALPRPLTPDTADPEQRAVLEQLASGQDLVVHGPPGSGRTCLALGAALASADRPTLLLSPRRASASPLRDAVALAGAAASVQVATPAAFGLAVLAEAEGAVPALVTGADQDALLAELIAAGREWDLPVEAATRTLPGFRAELREILSRAVELGISPDRLHHLARTRDRPAWADASRLLRGYLDVLDLEASTALDAPRRYDAGRMVRRAAEVVRAGEGPRLHTVVVDDAQDLTAAGIELVSALASAGTRTIVLTCPDAAVDTFRGARPDAAARIAASSPLASRTLTLRRSHRLPSALLAAVEDLRGRLPLAGAPTMMRRRPEPVGERPDAVATALLPDALEEARVIAGALRELHHGEQVPYDEMAIVCRSGGAVDDLADRLQRHGLAVTTSTRPRPLRDEAAVADLLRLAELGADGVPPDPEEAMSLLRGPYGEVDALRLRRIRRTLLDAARREDPDDEHDSARLLAAALVDEDVLGLPSADRAGRTFAPVHRLRRMIRAVREAGADASADITLWSAWEAAGLAEAWRETALGIRAQDADPAGARARQAGRRLDALTSLFASAERFVERRPTAGVQGFVDHVRAQAVPEDTLAVRATPRGRVRIATPAELAGSEVDTIVLAGLQEGAWPNTRLRSTLFGAAELVMVHEDPELPTEPAALRAAQREGVIADELRLAVSALSRARSRVLVTAVDGEELAPSALFTALRSRAGTGWQSEEALRADPGPAPEARSLVAALRRTLGQEDPAARREAAMLLSRLQEAGVPGADPRRWYHQRPSSEAPLRRGEEILRLSPSALDLAHACPQAWLLERSGGGRSAGPAQRIGTAMHALAEQHPDGAVPDALERLHRLLRPLHLEETWSGRRLQGHAEGSIAKLTEHLATSPPALAVEVPFRLRVDGVELRGTIDRLEDAGDGVRIVDLKTGRQAKTAAEADLDLQLASYQSAVRDGVLDRGEGETELPCRVTGADLVYVGTGTRRAAVRSQRALDVHEDPGWFDDLLTEVAADVAGPALPARPNPHCSRCPVRRSCPIQPEGAEL